MQSKAVLVLSTAFIFASASTVDAQRSNSGTPFTTTNFDDWSHAWVFGGGLMIPCPTRQ